MILTHPRKTIKPKSLAIFHYPSKKLQVINQSNEEFSASTLYVINRPIIRYSATFTWRKIVHMEKFSTNIQNLYFSAMEGIPNKYSQAINQCKGGRFQYPFTIENRVNEEKSPITTRKLP